MSLRSRLLRWAGILVGLVAAAPQAGAVEPPAGTSLATLQLSAFEYSWQRVRDTYPDPDMKGLDWDAVRQELLPRAAAARSSAEVRPIIQDMLDRLGESHFLVLPGDGSRTHSHSRGGDRTGRGGDGGGAREALPRAAAGGAEAARGVDSGEVGDLGMEVRLLPLRPRAGAREGVVVTRVAARSPAALAGVRPGWALQGIDGADFRDLVRSLPSAASPHRERRVNTLLLVRSLLYGSPGSTSVLTFLDGRDRVVHLRMRRRAPDGELTRFGNLPPIPTAVDHGVVPGTNVGFIRFNVFLAPVSEPFTRAMAELVRANVSGIVVDVRGNPGGIAALVMGLGGHFIATPGQSLGRMRTREGELQFVAIPRPPGQVFDGPVAVLVDDMSVSTAELFAAGLQSCGRARVFGQTSAGMALPSVMETLPNGDRLQFAMADLVDGAGRRLEGKGVVPDEPVPTTRDLLLAGHDAPMEAAVKWIASRPPRRAGDKPS